MNVRSAIFALACSLSAASLGACEKTSDVGAMQEEATGIAATYKATFDALATRFKALDERSRKIAPGLAQASPDFDAVRKLAGETQAKLSEMQNLASQAPATVKAAVAGDKARPELIRISGELQSRLQAGAIEVARNLDTLEIWLGSLETGSRGPQVAAAPTPPPAASTTEPTPPTTTDTNAGAGSGSGSGSGAAGGSVAPASAAMPARDGDAKPTKPARPRRADKDKDDAKDEAKPAAPAR